VNEIDPVKQLKLQEELRYIETEEVERWSRLVLDDLVGWSNHHIFSPRGGALTLDIPLGPPNAGVKYISLEPLRPEVMIRSSMVTDIYRDAFSFPLICRRFVTDTENLQYLHQNPAFSEQTFLFSAGVPTLDINSVLTPLRPYCTAMIKAHQAKIENRLESNDLHCRFVMFELMLVWTFFHELGHVVQQHYFLHSPSNSADRVDLFSEFDEEIRDREMVEREGPEPSMSDLRGQARELMADAEALDLALKYLLASGRLNFAMVYLLLCSISCMYQRFFANYDRVSQLPSIDTRIQWFETKSPIRSLHAQFSNY
jgi:hypothetical protein